MKAVINASLLVAGTAIGAGLIALPLMAVNLGIGLASIIILAMIFIAYQASMMTLDLNELAGKPDSIVEMSKNLSGRGAFSVTLLSFYLLSISLLTAYFSGITDSVKIFFDIKNDFFVVPFCGLGLCAILCLKPVAFSRLNSILVAILLMAITVSLVKIHAFHKITFPKTICNKSEFFAFLPVIFTSFGVQNICPYIYNYLNGDRKKINLAFFIGIAIPAAVYIIWIAFVFENILSRDLTFFEKLQNHQVSAGELVKFLCESSQNSFIDVSFKILSLFAIITSAIGIGLGLMKSIQEMITPSPRLASAIICFIPTVIVLIAPNIFISVLSFGGIIATIFVVFTPYYLLYKNGKCNKYAYTTCLIFGIMVAVSELLQRI